MNQLENVSISMREYGLSDKILQSAIINRGNNSRLKSFFERARIGEKLTVGFLGGSITFGSNASEGRSFANNVTKWLNERFPKSKINMVNAGFGGTGSVIGFYRMEEDLLRYSPDLVFLDFSVNDALDSEREGNVPYEPYEGIIRALLKTGAAVVILCFCDQRKFTFRDIHLKIAKHYGLSVVSMVDSIYSLVESGRLKWEDYSNDSVHPIDLGHLMISYIIENFLQLELDSPKDEVSLLTKPMFKRTFQNPNYYDYFNLPINDKGSFEKYDEYVLLRNGFVSSGKHPMIFQLSAVKELFLMILYSNDPTTGTAIIEVNGGKKEIDCYFKDGWGSKPLAINVFSSEVPKDTRVRIYPKSEHSKIIVLRICKS